jgi:response regulator RpfG family c-di-GMP phosphodiesterase
MEKKFLIIDDQAFFKINLVNTIELVSSEIKYTFEYAQNGEEGINKILENDFDIITIDVNMPIMNGEEMINKISQQTPEKLTNALCFLITSQGYNKELGSIIEKFNIYWLSKPIDFKKFAKNIEKFYLEDKNTFLSAK